MEADEVQPRPRHQRRQPLHELQRAHEQVRAAVAPRRLAPELHLPGGVELHAFVRQRGPGDAAARSLEPPAAARFQPSCRCRPFGPGSWPVDRVHPRDRSSLDFTRVDAWAAGCGKPSVAPMQFGQCTATQPSPAVSLARTNEQPFIAPVNADPRPGRRRHSTHVFGIGVDNALCDAGHAHAPDFIVTADRHRGRVRLRRPCLGLWRRDADVLRHQVQVDRVVARQGRMAASGDRIASRARCVSPKNALTCSRSAAQSSPGTTGRTCQERLCPMQLHRVPGGALGRAQDSARGVPGRAGTGAPSAWHAAVFERRRLKSGRVHCPPAAASSRCRCR